LDQILPKKLTELGIGKDKVVGDRPAHLVALKIKEKYVGSENSSYRTTDDTKDQVASRTANLSSFSTMSHYNFIL